MINNIRMEENEGTKSWNAVRGADQKKYIESELTGEIIRCAMEVHSELGPGLMESSYEECLCYELMQVGFRVERQKGMPLVYKEVKMDIGYRVDLLVEGKVIIELKAVDAFEDVHTAQVLTYLKLSKCRVGLLINFKVAKLKDGIKRLVL